MKSLAIWLCSAAVLGAIIAIAWLHPLAAIVLLIVLSAALGFWVFCLTRAKW